jgi:hypothetical protein
VFGRLLGKTSPSGGELALLIGLGLELVDALVLSEPTSSHCSSSWAFELADAFVWLLEGGSDRRLHLRRRDGPPTLNINAGRTGNLDQNRMACTVGFGG